MAVLVAAMAALMMWFAADARIYTNYRGPPSFLDLMLGHEGVKIATVTFGIWCAVGTLFAVRLLLSRDRLAARADHSGVVLRGIWGTARFARSEIRMVRLYSVRIKQRMHHYVRIDALGRRSRMISVMTIEGGVEAATAWIAAARRLLAGPPPPPPPAPARSSGRRTFGRALARPL